MPDKQSLPTFGGLVGEDDGTDAIISFSTRRPIRRKLAAIAVFEKCSVLLLVQDDLLRSPSGPSRTASRALRGQLIHRGRKGRAAEG